MEFISGLEGIIMNRFAVLSCVDLAEETNVEYDGTVVLLNNTEDPSLMLFFPISSQNAEVINYIIEDENEYDEDTSILGIYKTMLNSWQAGGRFLSGVIIDTILDKELNKEIPLIRLVLSDSNGMIDSLVMVNFVHAILLSAMEKVEILISDSLLDIMLPNAENATVKLSNSESRENFPEDKNIINIAKQIMEGAVRENNSNKNKKNNGDQGDTKQSKK